MRLGMFMMPVHPPARSFTETLAEDEEKSLYADALGFDEIVARRAFLRDHRADPLAADVHGEPRAAHQESQLRHRRDLPAEPPSGDRRRRGCAVRSHEPRPLHVRHRSGRAPLRLRAVRQRGPQRARPQGHGIHRASSSASGRRTRPTICPGEFWTVQIKDAIIPQLGIGYMPKPFQKPRPADHHVGRQPELGDRARRGPARLEYHLRPTTCRPARWRPTGRPTARRAPKPGKPARGENWRVARNVMVAPSDAEAHDRIYGDRRLQPLFLYLHARSVVARRHPFGHEAAIRTCPTMRQRWTRSPRAAPSMARRKTFLDKLVAFRDEVGPFGTLLMTGLDWSGPNANGSAIRCGSWRKRCCRNSASTRWRRRRSDMDARTRPSRAVAELTTFSPSPVVTGKRLVLDGNSKKSSVR